MTSDAVLHLEYAFQHLRRAGNATQLIILEAGDLRAYCFRLLHLEVAGMMVTPASTSRGTEKGLQASARHRRRGLPRVHVPGRALWPSVVLEVHF